MSLQPENAGETTFPGRLVVVRNLVTLAEVARLPDRGIRKRQRDLEDFFGQTLRDVVAGFPEPMASSVDRGLAINVITVPWQEEEDVKAKDREVTPPVYATNNDYVQIALSKSSGQTREEDANRSVYALTHLLQTAGKEMRGGTLLIRAEKLARRVGRFTAGLVLERAKGVIQNDCEQVDLAALGPFEILLGARQVSDLNDAANILRGRSFKDARFELVIEHRVPMHTTFVAPYSDNLSVAAFDNIRPNQTKVIFIPNTRGVPVTAEELPEALLEPTKIIQWRKTVEVLEQMGIEGQSVMTQELALKTLGLRRMSKKKAGIVGLGLAAAAIGAGIFLHKRKS